MVRSSQARSSKREDDQGRPKPQVVRIGPKGVITIPEENRKAMDVAPGKYVTAIQIGRNLMLSPDINDFLVLAEEFQAKMSEAGISSEQIMADQEAARRRLYEELYGQDAKKSARRRA